MTDQQKQLRTLSEDYQKLQEGDKPRHENVSIANRKYHIIDLRSNVAARQKLESQQQENRGVQKVRKATTYSHVSDGGTTCLLTTHRSFQSSRMKLRSINLWGQYC